jgi:hypothetical protein
MDSKHIGQSVCSVIFSGGVVLFTFYKKSKSIFWFILEDHSKYVFLFCHKGIILMYSLPNIFLYDYFLETFWEHFGNFFGNFLLRTFLFCHKGIIFYCLHLPAEPASEKNPETLPGASAPPEGGVEYFPL